MQGCGVVLDLGKLRHIATGIGDQGHDRIT